MSTCFTCTLESPIGRLRLCSTDEGLTHVLHANQQENLPDEWVENPQHPILTRALAELGDYFTGTRTSFTLPLTPTGTDFQKDVWQALQTIPYGQTCSYVDIATQIDRPKAVRAVGTANGSNPISIFIPCHRVIGKNGTLTGYAGGLSQKKILLDLETQNTPLILT